VSRQNTCWEIRSISRLNTVSNMMSNCIHREQLPTQEHRHHPVFRLSYRVRLWIQIGLEWHRILCFSFQFFDRSWYQESFYFSACSKTPISAKPRHWSIVAINETKWCNSIVRRIVGKDWDQMKWREVTYETRNIIERDVIRGLAKVWIALLYYVAWPRDAVPGLRSIQAPQSWEVGTSPPSCEGSLRSQELPRISMFTTAARASPETPSCNLDRLW
jgi:hypothetical protein